MSDMVQFKEAFFRSSQVPQSLEDAIRLMGSYAGIHLYDFQDVASETFSDLDNWDVDDGLTASVVGGELDLTGGGDPIFYLCKYNYDDVPLSLVASFDFIEGLGGFFFRKAGLSQLLEPVFNMCLQLVDDFLLV